MSESAPERSSGGNAFTRKVGPLPLWGWMAIIAVVAFAYSYYKKSKATSSAGTSTASTTTAVGSNNTPGGVDSSLVPQFINQTYNQETPPAAPNVTVNNTLPAPPVGGTQPSPTPAPTQTTTVKPPSVKQYQAPSGLSTKKVTSTSLTATWNNLTGVTPPPSSYTVAIYSSAGKLLSQQTINAPDTTGGKSTATITGLPANATGLQVHVWANGGQLAPPHASSTLSL
jgi:hypothetical protein